MIRRDYRVVLGDTDAAGRIFFAAPPRWFHALWEEYLESRNLPLSQLLKGDFHTPIVSMQFDFKSSLQVGDLVTLRICKLDISEKSFTCFYEALKADRVVIEGRMTHVTIDKTSGKSILLPPTLKKALAS